MVCNAIYPIFLENGRIHHLNQFDHAIVERALSDADL